MEHSHLTGTPLYGIHFDYAKCFDQIPHSILFSLLERMGLPSMILRPSRGMYKQLQRRFRCGGGCGREFRSTNGILQGCPISVLYLNALISIWIRAVSAEVPKTSP